MKGYKVAFIGSSPIMCLYIDKLCEFADCTVFEGGEVGGAWAESGIRGVAYPVANNIICPASREEEKYVAEIEKTLTLRGARISVHRTRLELLSSYIPEQYIVGHFFPVVTAAIGKGDVSIKRRKVARIEAHEKHAVVDGEVFDAVVMPSNLLLEAISVNGETLGIGFETIVSKHMRVLFSEAIEGPHYSENFDNVFDRGGMMPPTANIFIGRVRREIKERPLPGLVNESRFIQEKADKIVTVDMNFYPNHRPRDGELLKLRERIENTAAFCVETRQFVDAFSRIPTVCAAIEHKLCG